MLSSLLRRTGLTTTLVRPQLLLTAQSISGFFVWRFASHKSKAPTGQESRKAEAISEHDKNRSIDTEKPKRPLNAYMLFFAEFLAHNAQFNRRSAMRPSAVAWKTLNVEKMRLWKEKMIADGRESILSVRKRKKPNEAKKGKVSKAIIADDDEGFE
uniref:HMG box domain-containing protein n=1 Tax=Plectus sambesii TaxID=2011161 RepID=A0A914V403_9BILA